MEKRKEKLGGYLKVSYGLADLGFIFMVTMSNTYLLMFYTDVAGITAAAAGTLMMVGRIIDSCSPPVIGAVIEKSHMKWGKYRSWLIIGAPLIFVTNALMFLNNRISMPAKAVLACIVYAVFCISTNIAYTGYTSMNSSLTNDQKERVQLSTFRGQGNALGKCLAGFLLIPLITILGGGKEMNAGGFFLASIVAGIVCVLLYGNLVWVSKGKDIQSMPGDSGKKDSLKAGEMLGLVLKNRNLMLLFLTDVTRILSMLVMQRHRDHCLDFRGIYRLFLGKCGEYLHVRGHCGLRGMEDREECQGPVLFHVPAFHQDRCGIQYRHSRLRAFHGGICGKYRTHRTGHTRNPCHLHGTSGRSFDSGGSAACVL